MLHILATAVNAVMPIILLILLGYLLRRRRFLSEDFLKVGNKLVFRVCLPCMLFINVYNIESLGAIQWDIVLFSVGVLLGIFLMGIGLAVATTKVPERRGVLLQCAFRSNFAIIGLSLTGALGGSGAEATAAVVSAFTIPLFNVLAVVSLSMFVGHGGGNRGIGSVAHNIVKNPLIIGVFLGLVCLVVRSVQVRLFGEVVFSLKTQTKFLYTAVNNLKSIASPLALIVLGGQFEFSAVKGMRREILVGTLWRTVAAPLLGVGAAVLLSKGLGIFSWGVNEYPALIALFGSPVAVSSAIMAGQMGNDEQLATQLVVWTSLCSIVTIFAQVCVMMAMGLLAV